MQRRARVRQQIPTFALIGYTNVGKSTLLNYLTDAGIFVEDKLFATLDTTTRKFLLPNNQEILLIDTVGFIRKLPHLVVAAFRSTLEEAFGADFLLHVVDASHPLAKEQVETTFSVLKELDADKKPLMTVINKCDLCEDTCSIQKLRFLCPRNVQISAKTGEGMEDLLTMLGEELKKRRKRIFLRIPQKEYHVIHEILENGNIIQQEYEENDILLEVDIPLILVGKVEKYQRGD